MKRLAFGLSGEKLHAVQNCGDHDFCLKKEAWHFFFTAGKKKMIACVSHINLTIKHSLGLLTDIFFGIFITTS